MNGALLLGAVHLLHRAGEVGRRREKAWQDKALFEMLKSIVFA